MKKFVLICLSFLVLIGCSNNYNQKLSGKEVNAKLEKLGIELEYYANSSKYIEFSLPKKDEPDNPYILLISYSNGEVKRFVISEDADEVAPSYTYDIDDEYSYVYLYDGSCSYAIDGKTPKGKVCSGKKEKEANSVYNEFEKKIFKEIGITKEDLITFGNWYNKNNTD